MATVRLWHARPEDVPSDPEAEERLVGLLSAGERARRERLHFPRDRRLYLLAHALVRVALSREAGLDPASWRFEADEQGKPRLEGATPGPPLHFSLTHTDGLVACVVAPVPEVGVDAESLGRRGSFEALARRFFAASERRLLAETATASYADTFLDLWTLKEAYLKARGTGLRLPTASLAFTPGDPPAVSFAPPIEDEAASWRFARIRLPGHRLAVALRDGSLELEAAEGAPLLR